MSQLCCCHLEFLEIVSNCPDALWILPGSSLSLQQSEKNKAPKKEGGTWINNLWPHDSAPVFRSLLFFWGFEKGLRIVYKWSDVCLMQHGVFSVSFDLTPMKSGHPISGICIMQFLLDLLGIMVDKYLRGNFFAWYQAKCLILNIKWIKIAWRRHWENLAMSQWLEPPVKKESFKLGWNSSWNPILEETRVELLVVNNSWATTFSTGIFWVVLLPCSFNVSKFFLQGW